MHDRPGSPCDPTYSTYPFCLHARPGYMSDDQVQTLVRQIQEELRQLRTLIQERHADIHPLEDIQHHVRELRDIIKFWVEEEKQRQKAMGEAARE